MDDSSFEAANKFFETEKNYMPVFSYKKYSYKNKNIKKYSWKKNIKVTWLGRLDEDKYYAISSLIKNLSKISNIAEIELNIIGTGNFQDKVNQDCIFYKIKTIFHGLIHQENLDKFLIENSDLVFAMGKSVIEAAKLGIPSVITPVYPENDFGDNDYVWSFNAKGYELSLKESHRLKLKGKVITLEKIFDEFLKTDMNSLGKKCLNHYLSYHSVELGISKIIYAASNAIPIKKYSKLLNHISGIDIFNKLVKKVLNILKKNRKLRNFLKRIRSFFIDLINYLN